jgi:tetratricopeptide (TPR) repeat protein
MASLVDEASSGQRPRIGNRFRVDAVLGRGGMATVYRVFDETTQRELALKQLVLAGDATRRKEVMALFEREFMTLVQLSHPRVIEVYDYGIENSTPYYTMELLDGGDLRERSPLPWREACALLANVCSSLALIHSRRLVHRDLTPANVRITRDGGAKLIDFGAMAPIGDSHSIVGTPAFVAPEAVLQRTLDGRTDLFSLGATLYFTLTGQPPYPARSFSQLNALWRETLPPPSSVVEGIPDALDVLVMSLLALEPAMRPRTAFEVIQRLTAIAGLERTEPVSVSQAYLSTPVMVGRDEAMKTLRNEMSAAFAEDARTVLIEGPPGMGRSRVLDACAVEGKVLGATVLRIHARTIRGEGFAVAWSLAEQLLERLSDTALRSAQLSGALPVLFEPVDGQPPRLRALAGSAMDPLLRETALSDWILHVAQTEPLLLAVDNVHALDESCGAFLASLALRASRARLLIALTVETGTEWTAPAARDVLAARARRLALQPLTRQQSELLLGSLFGEVQNLGGVSEGIHRASGGNPRECMDLARHLVNRGVISYGGGGWTLPAALDPTDLPRGAEEAIRDRISALQPLSRWLAEAQALAGDAFARQTYGALRPDCDSRTVDRAIGELLSNQVLVRGGELYSLAHRGLTSSLMAGLSSDARAGRHRALAALYDQELPMAAVRHLLAAGQHERGLDRLLELLAGGAGFAGDTQIPSSELAATIEKALDVAIAFRRPPRQLHELRLYLIRLSVGAEEAYYWRVAPTWLTQLKRDSSAARPESDRVYTRAEAIRHLAYYVVVSIAIGSRSGNSELLESLPPLLEPFAAISPIIDVILENARATCESRCRAQLDQARSRWIDVYERLGRMTTVDLPYRDRLRNAVAFGIGTSEVRMGLASASTWAEALDRDPRQHVNALYLRKVLALQMGDAEAAEGYRRKAEVLSLHAMDRQMFNSTLPLELAAHALAGDLTGVKDVMARIEPLASAHPGWRAFAKLAQAHFQQLRDNPAAALAAFEACLSMTSFDPADSARPLAAWPSAIAGTIEALIRLGRHTEARERGQEALATCKRLHIGFLSHDISRATAIAEAKLNDFEAAIARVEAVIAEQKKLGVVGMNLGASYEARAKIAIWNGDEAALDQYAALTAREYRHGQGSALGARWERLMTEARRVSRSALPRLEDFKTSAILTAGLASAAEIVGKMFQDAPSAEARAACALKLLCEDRGASAGHLFLATDTGLKLVASQGPSAPPNGLLAYVQSYYETEVLQNGDATAALTGEQMASALVAREPFRDRSGLEHQPVLMTSLVDGASSHAGVAVFVEGANVERERRPAKGAALVAELSAHLIRLGDTRVR